MASKKTENDNRSPARMWREKTTVLSTSGTSAEDGKLSCGYSSFKGRRPTMEDRYDVKFAKMKGQSVSLFGVFDETTFLKTDADFLESVTTPYREDGSTALAAVLVGDQIYVANVGDSRAIALKGGKAIPLSDDHKPNLKDERTRIENAGGGVSYDGFTWRVDGILAMSRAFGNRSLKNYVIAEPDIQICWMMVVDSCCNLNSNPEVTTFNLGLYIGLPTDFAIPVVVCQDSGEACTYADCLRIRITDIDRIFCVYLETQVSSDLEYLVLATDGLWDVVQNEDVISLMRATDEPEVAAVKLTEMAHSRHSSDNITCIVVGFHH
uniref:protein-serine/threonine phosphatase n=1 Tax=Aegilops tauschii TaxID=37682 RepID=M8BQS0_AEGTA